MNQITAIEPQKSTDTRVNVYIDQKYAFSCHKEVIIKFHIHTGDQVDSVRLSQIIKEDEIKKGFQKALTYLSYRSRTKQEVYDYLEKKEYRTEIIQEVLAKLSYYQYIDDQQFAIDFTKSKINYQGKGKSLVKQDLMKKGVKNEHIEQALETIPLEDEILIAKNLSKKFFLAKSNLPIKELKNKLSARLSSKGFSWEIIHQCQNFLDHDTEVQSIIFSKSDIYETEALKIGEKVLQKHQSKVDNNYQLKQIISSKLYQKGFEKDLISQITRQLLD
ncbi:regulatory protein RecX [Alkaliphilus metalliredigens QYMF]|uniref:Regulatory protein RecX n=1 Tax=Alkaliphilus metalliredigens (strain QYMF) TaxID=293826 RepID=A6TR50_ALKMQ|nr:RecX family transcriptional regulator [Alkaliphilus metalliredigens]ABR48668.1 regulatory protein RecX [Alkaliphilus metalliredigens QYMF]